jgi:regulator of replication initiation timing
VTDRQLKQIARLRAIIGNLHETVEDLTHEMGQTQTENDCLRKWLRDFIAVDNEDIDTVVSRMLAPEIEPES